MKKLKFILVVNLFIISNLYMEAQNVEIKEMPQTIESFVALRDKIADTPEGGAAIFLVALKIYVDNQELGEQCLVISVDMNGLRSGDTYKGYSLLNSDMSLIKSQILDKNKKVPDSYIKGSSPENNYTVKLPYVYEFSSNPYSGDAKSGTYKIFVKCSGADSARPITLKQNNHGIWKASNFSSVLVGIKKTPVSDDL